MSARCGVRAARVAHAASTKGTEWGEGSRGEERKRQLRLGEPTEQSEEAGYSF